MIGGTVPEKREVNGNGLAFEVSKISQSKDGQARIEGVSLSLQLKFRNINDYEKFMKSETFKALKAHCGLSWNRA